MYTEKVTYVDYNGVEQTGEYQFNLTKAEITKMEMSVAGGLAERIQRAINAQNQPEIIEIFEDLIKTAYGVKSPDGKKFMKSPEILDDFVQSPAYSEIFMLYATDSAAAAKFINGIVPADMAKQMNSPALVAKANN